MDRRITIQRPGPSTDDGYTTKPGELVDYYSCSAKWMPAKGRETFENIGREALSFGVFAIRRNPTSAAIRATDKVSYGGLVWDIVNVMERDRDGIELMVVAGEIDDADALLS